MTDPLHVRLARKAETASNDADAALWREAAEHHKRLLAVSLAYESWEADLITSDEAWNGGAAEFPTLTESLWDRLLEIQALRNEAVRAAKHSPEETPDAP